MFLRQKGLYEATLEKWKKEMLEGLKIKPFVGGKKDPQRKRIAALERELRRKEAALAEAALLLVPKKKDRCDLGGRKGREISLEDRRRCRELIEEAVDSGAQLWKSCEVLEISVRTYQRWAKDWSKGDSRHHREFNPPNRLSEEQGAAILAITTSMQFRDLPLSQIVPRLAEEGVYVASESSFCRLLRQEKLLKHRETSRPPVNSRPKEYVATGPTRYGAGILPIFGRLRGPVLLPVPGGGRVEPHDRGLEGRGDRVLRNRRAYDSGSLSAICSGSGSVGDPLGQRRSDEGSNASGDPAGPGDHSLLQPAAGERGQPVLRDVVSHPEIPRRVSGPSL